MPINQTIARLSDLSFQSAFAVYLLALVLLIWHYAATRTDHVHRFELGSRKLVAAGGVSAPSPEVPGRIVSAPPKPVPERLGNMGAAVLVVGLGLHLVSIVLRGFATGRFPLGNMYEFVTMATAAATATGIVFLRGQTYRAMWVFLLAPVLILMFVAATLLYADAAPVVPALQSYWLPIHVTIVSIGSGVFLVSGVASLAFLLRIRQPAGAERRGPVGSMARRLPDAQTLDRLAYRT
ncbi:MAG: cytochrome c biogenesis protein, partial [Rhodococcus qingshengii]